MFETLSAFVWDEMRLCLCGSGWYCNNIRGNIFLIKGCGKMLSQHSKQNFVEIQSYISFEKWYFSSIYIEHQVAFYNLSDCITINISLKSVTMGRQCEFR